MQMKLGVSYNLFDGYENLRKSVMSIRANVDYINVVFQPVSNIGNPLSKLEFDKTLLLLQELLNNKLINKIIPYNRSTCYDAQKNEILKRNIGLKDVKENRCTHFMTIDADEVYIPKQLAEAKCFIEQNKLINTACKMQTYYKTSEYKLVPPEEYYVPLIYDIRIADRFLLPAQTNFVCDPTRKMSGEYHLFERDIIEMHHLSYVRKDLRLKLVNSSAAVNFTPERIDFVVDYYNNWEFPKNALILQKELVYFDVKKQDFKI